MSEMKVSTWEEVKWSLPPGVANFKVADIVGEPVVITHIEEVETSFGAALRFVCEFHDKSMEVLTHSKVLLKQLLACRESLPIQTTIIKSGRSFTLS